MEFFDDESKQNEPCLSYFSKFVPTSSKLLRWFPSCLKFLLALELDSYLRELELFGQLNSMIWELFIELGEEGN